MKDLIEAIKADLLSEVETAAEKNDDGKVQPPIEAITFKFGFCDLYPTIVAIFVASAGSIVVTVKGCFPLQSSLYQ